MKPDRNIGLYSMNSDARRINELSVLKKQQNLLLVIFFYLLMPSAGSSKRLNMNPLFFLFVIIFNGVSSLNPHSNFKEKDSLKLNKELYTNMKIMESQNFFSPRMDYDEWTPLGRGDPLKNDPTYDYVPPVLERVHYWMDPSKRTPDPPSPHSGVLVLGSRTESSFTSRSTTPRYYLYQTKEADSRFDTGSLLDPFLNLMDMSKFGINFNSNNHLKTPPKRVLQRLPQIQNNFKITPSNTKSSPQALQRPPYTMLMPPPLLSSFPQEITTSKSNRTTHSPIKLEVSQITTAPPFSTSVQSINVTTERPLLANTDNMFKPVAITMPEHIEGTENEMHNEITVKMKPTKPTTEHITMVLPIVKLFDNKLTKAESITSKRPELYHPLVKQETTLYEIKQKSKIPIVQEITTEKLPLETKSFQKSSSYKINFLAKTILTSDTERNLQVTTSNPITTTTSLTYRVPSLTTDPMFKHYKQPSQLVRGPFYLIIQGHSKVKTYGASKNPINRLLTSNEIKFEEDDDKNKKFKKKNRKLRFSFFDSEVKEKSEKLDDIQSDAIRSLALTQDNLENLEETFGKSAGGNSKKRYLNTDFRIKRSAYDTINVNSRKLLQTESESHSNTEKLSSGAFDKSDNLDLESLIAINNDYDSSDVAHILLNQDKNSGSGFGDFTSSIFARSQNEYEKSL